MVGVGQADGPPEMEPRIEDLNAGVAGVEHEQFTGSDYRLARQCELARPVTSTTLAGLRDEPSSVVHDNNHVPTRIADINASCRSVNGDPRRTLEVRFSSAQCAQGVAKLSRRVVDKYGAA